MNISVVIPCFNLGAWLDEAIDSCHAQTHAPFEIVVIDDGSTDPATRARFDHWEPARARLVRTENRGLPAARNCGIRETTGDALCFLDADDRLCPGFLERGSRAFDADPSLDIVSCWLREFGESESVYRPERADLETLLAECSILTPAMVRRRAAVAAGGYDEELWKGYEDWDFWIRLVAAGSPVLIVPEILFEYRRRTGSMVETSYYGEDHLPLMRYLFEKHSPLYARYFESVRAHQEAEIADMRNWLDGDAGTTANAPAAAAPRSPAPRLRPEELDALMAAEVTLHALRKRGLARSRIAPG